MSPPKHALVVCGQLDKYCRVDKNGGKTMLVNRDPETQSSEPSPFDLIKVLENISTCQNTLTTKIEEIEKDIS